MNHDKLKINQLIDIELEVIGGCEGDISPYELHPSRIEDVGKNHLLLAMPFKHGYPVPIHTGEAIRLKFIQGKDAYACDVKITGRQMSPIALLKTTMPEKVIHIQHRNWVRLPYIIPVKYRMHDYNMDFFEALTIDISGGGLLIQTKHPIDTNELLNIKFCLENLTIDTVGKVVRSSPFDDCFRIAVNFEEINDKERDKIVGFIFQKQREIIQKGLK